MRKSHLLAVLCVVGFGLITAACGKSASELSASISPLPSPSPSLSPTPSAVPSGSPSAAPATAAAKTAAPTAAPKAATPKPRAPQTFTLTQKDNGKHLSLVKGDTVKLDLETNPSTGYHWDYDQKPNAAVLKEISSTATPAPASPGVVGAPETEEWTYHAVGAGSTGAKLRYNAPGQTSGGTQTFSFSVTVG